jgi:CcmD family protein
MFTLAIGFGAAWLFVACYLTWIGLRQRHLEARLESLQSRLASQASSSLTSGRARAA